MDKDWAEAINEEYGTDVQADESIEDTSGEDNTDDTGAESTDSGRIDDDGQGDLEESGEGDGQGDEDDNGEGEDTGQEENENPKAEASDEKEAQPNPKDALKEALRELESESRQDTETKQALKSSVMERLYPEGVDRQLRDSDGDPINSIDDLTGLINPATGDLFTEDEAGSWLLSAQQKLNQDIEQMERQAEQVVEVDLNLRQGADRVEELYADVFKAHPEVYDKLMQQYNSTIVRDPQSGLVIETPVDIEDFYATALSGYMKSIELQQAQAATEAKARKEQERYSQRERGDLSRIGHTTNLNKEDQGWADAMNEYYND